MDSLQPVSLIKTKKTQGLPPLPPVPLHISISLSLMLLYQGKATWLCNEKVAVHKPGRRTSQEPNLASTLILGFPGSRTMRNRCLLFEPPNLRYCVTAAQTD